MKIYFAHSTSDYNTEYESSCLQKIKNEYPDDEIIKPKDIVISNEDKKKLMGKHQDYISMMKKYHFPEIDNCELLISFKQSKSKKYSNGVKLEIEYAEQNEIKILEW